SWTAGDVAPRIAAVAWAEIACRVALVNARCAFACALKNASSHVALSFQLRRIRHKRSNAHATVAYGVRTCRCVIMAVGRKYHARLRENRRPILRCPLCRDLGCARATQY